MKRKGIGAMIVNYFVHYATADSTKKMPNTVIFAII